MVLGSRGTLASFVLLGGRCGCLCGRCLACRRRLFVSARLCFTMSFLPVLAFVRVLLSLLVGGGGWPDWALLWL